ncbi:MAG: leucine-rich repeat domain-containing protein, partial [Muribaculaceae bacterium]|nr:leucine-rich repeat domain-containing protein [Muribaculaceae bacterium]
MAMIENLKSESGVFSCIGGKVTAFTPAAHNVIEGGLEALEAWGDGWKHYENAVRTLIVPSGIRSFSDRFLRDWAVTDLFILPDTLESIGDENMVGCVFANCFLPEVVLPESLRFIGTFAFGHSYIKRLVIRETIKSPYLRQFKDTTIEQLYLPKIALEKYRTGMEAGYGFYR